MLNRIVKQQAPTFGSITMSITYTQDPKDSPYIESLEIIYRTYGTIDMILVCKPNENGINLVTSIREIVYYPGYNKNKDRIELAASNYTIAPRVELFNKGHAKLLEAIELIDGVLVLNEEDKSKLKQDISAQLPVLNPIPSPSDFMAGKRKKAKATFLSESDLSDSEEENQSMHSPLNN